MIKSNLANFFVLIILGLVAAFGYYRAFLTLITRRVNLNPERVVRGNLALVFGLIFLAGAIAASAVTIFFYFSTL